MYSRYCIRHLKSKANTALVVLLLAGFCWAQTYEVGWPTPMLSTIFFASRNSTQKKNLTWLVWVPLFLFLLYLAVLLSFFFFFFSSSPFFFTLRSFTTSFPFVSSINPSSFHTFPVFPLYFPFISLSL